MAKVLLRITCLNRGVSHTVYLCSPHLDRELFNVKATQCTVRSTSWRTSGTSSTVRINSKLAGEAQNISTIQLHLSWYARLRIRVVVPVLASGSGLNKNLRPLLHCTPWGRKHGVPQSLAHHGIHLTMLYHTSSLHVMSFRTPLKEEGGACWRQSLSSESSSALNSRLHVKQDIDGDMNVTENGR